MASCDVMGMLSSSLTHTILQVNDTAAPAEALVGEEVKTRTARTRATRTMPVSRCTFFSVSSGSAVAPSDSVTGGSSCTMLRPLCTTKAISKCFNDAASPYSAAKSPDMNAVTSSLRRE